MKIDPNNYCITYKQNLFWAMVHDVIAHPLMALTFYKIKMFIKFHDYTSALAWDRRSMSNEHARKGLGMQTMTAPTGKKYSMKVVKHQYPENTYIETKI